MVHGRSYEHTRNTPCEVWEEITLLLKSTGQGMPRRGEDEHAPAPEREKRDTRPTVAAPSPTVRRLCTTRSHIREDGATEGCPRCKGIEAGRSRPRNNECRTRIRAREEQSEEGREGLKKEEQRQERHLEKAVMRSVSDDPELSRAEEEHKRKLVEIENDNGPRESEAERQVKKRNQDHHPDEDMDHKSDDVRSIKRKPEDEGEREDAKRQDNMIVSCSREEELTRRGIHETLRTRGRCCIGSVEESEDKNANIAMDVPVEEDCEQGFDRSVGRDRRPRARS